jgi:hypothetical protein
MIFVSQKALINHDYFKILNSVYPIIRTNIDKIVLSFEEGKDASTYYVEYFSEGHSEIHSNLGEHLSCNDINQLLADLFSSIIKFDSQSSNYEIPSLFYNYHAVHYFNKIKDMIARLDKTMDRQRIIETLINYEQNRHQSNECDCGENHDLLRSDGLYDLFNKLLDYYYSLTKSYSEINQIYIENEKIYLN